MTREELFPYLHHVVRLDCQGPVGHAGRGRSSKFGVLTDLGPGAGIVTQTVVDDDMTSGSGGLGLFLYEQVRRIVDYGLYTRAASTEVKRVRSSRSL